MHRFSFLFSTLWTSLKIGKFLHWSWNFNWEAWSAVTRNGNDRTLKNEDEVIRVARLWKLATPQLVVRKFWKSVCWLLRVYRAPSGGGITFKKFRTE
jgi:hypothetical protein